MAEVILGDIVARLRVDNTQFEQALTQAQQRLGQLNQTTAQTTSQQGSANQSTRQLAQAYTALAQSLTQQTQATTRQTQATTQATGAAQQYRQSLTQLTTGLQAQQQAQQQATAATTQASTAFRAMLQVAGGIGIATGISALVSQMKDLAVETVQVGARMEQLRASLGAIAGSRGTGADQFQAILNTANQLGVAFEPLARGWRTLTAAATAANIPIEVQRNLFNAVATEARRVGASNEEVQRSLLALGQIASKGKVSMEEFRQQLAEAIPTAGGAAAKGFGVTQEALQKLIESGVGAETFFKALTRGFEDIQRGSVQVGDTATAAFNRLGNAILSLQDAIAQSGLLKFLKDAADGATNLLNTVGNYFKARKLLEDTEREAATRELGFKPGQVTPAEQQRFRELEEQIREAQAGRVAAQPGSPLEGMTVPLGDARREERLRSLLQEQEALRDVIRTRVAYNEAQAKGTDEQRRQQKATADQLELEQKLQKLREDGQRKLKAFEERAALQPEILGRAGGTGDELETYRRNRQKVLEENAKAMSDAVEAARAQGTPIPPAVLEGIRNQSKEYGNLTNAIKTADEAEKKRRQTERETAAQAERAISQRIQIEHLLTEAKAFGAREDQNVADQARARVEAQGEALRTRLEQQLNETRRNPQIGGDYAQQLRDRLAALPGQIEAQAADAYAKALEKQIEPLRRLAGLYGDAAEGASELAKAQAEAAKFVGTPKEEEAKGYLEFLERLIQLQREAAESAPAGMRAREQANRTITFDQSVADQLERLRLPREERLEDRLRDQARKQGVDITPETEAQLKAISQQERFNQLMEVSSRLGDTVAQNLTNGLLNVASGAERVGDAFKNMAKAILDSVAQLAVSEGFKLLIGIGLRALSGAAGGVVAPSVATAGADTSIAGVSSGGAFSGSGLAEYGAQHGAIVTRPTTVLVGENPATTPEYILNRDQMHALVQSAMQVQSATPRLPQTLPRGPAVPPAMPAQALFAQGPLQPLLDRVRESLPAVHRAQGGAVVNRPTHLLVGENQATNPEYVLNRQQMGSLMNSARQAGPSAGGQAVGGANVTVINYTEGNRERAEARAAQERTLGKQVVLNYVMDDLAAGSGSRINQMIRAGSR